MKNNRKYIICGLFTACLGLLNSGAVHAKDVSSKIKRGIESVSDSLKKEVDKISGGLEAIQDYLNHYSWKGIVEDRVTSGVATLENLKLNGHSKAVVAYPCEKIEGKIKCFLDPKQCNSLSLYRVVIGIKGVGPQTTLCNYLGTVAGESEEQFSLLAPNAPGVYEIRFRVMESFLESDALNAWIDSQGQEPNACSTIGIIVVK